jgi:hypothetical protein
VIVPNKNLLLCCYFRNLGAKKHRVHLKAVLPHILLNHTFGVHRYFSCMSSGVARILKRSAEVMVSVHNFATFILPELMYLRTV